MAKRAKHEFVVGFVGEHYCVYGMPTWTDGEGHPRNAWTGRMTATQALHKRRKLSGDPKTIYRVVPVTVVEVEAQAKRERKAKGKRKE